MHTQTERHTHTHRLALVFNGRNFFQAVARFSLSKETILGLVRSIHNAVCCESFLLCRKRKKKEKGGEKRTRVYVSFCTAMFHQSIYV